MTHQYQTQTRLILARKLLRLGASPIQVAQDSGFCDQSHLNRQFKRAFGTTPGQFVQTEKSSRWSQD
ncbi:AraC family transcriptional regulator [Shewanella algae]|uniref:helix-turn-helix domain-containing protein n=1 Tax=Shewanella algae TaxID=38313 RepID=UPI000E3D5976|nr:AraC family transcriptional regulator [Shewanella algae]QXP21428.1 AraC family transcriptional regulator [Shewanella algae]QXP31941.1 AraC family transcriptional regulator [Shewanella algae]QXP36184.1 AraC family transcriptional regulator [Shewanella algae]QXP40287.1 AraC family transcriptional regulator [Shewanella algae]UYA15390.1 helix-turn-helix domain-containing protein [Shewanella algae]